MKKILTTTLLLIAIHFAAVQAIADMYKWVDQNGVVHFSDDPPTSEQNVEILETSNYQEPPPKPDLSESKLVTKPTPEKMIKKDEYNKKKGNVNYSNKVEIYTTSWCRYCKNAIAFLRSNRVDYKQYDIEKDPKAAEKMKALGGRGGVPFAIINEKKIYGFSTKSYKQALGLQ